MAYNLQIDSDLDALERSRHDWLDSQDVDDIFRLHQDLTISLEKVEPYEEGLYLYDKWSIEDDIAWEPFEDGKLTRKKYTTDDIPMRYDVSRILLDPMDVGMKTTYEKRIYIPRPSYNSFFLAHFRVRNIIDGESEEDTGEDIDSEDSEDSEDSGDSEDSEDSGGDDGDEAILEEGNNDGDGDDDDDSGSDDAPTSNGHPKVVPDGPYSVVQNNTQYAVDGTSEISQQPSTFTKQDHMLIVTSNCGSQSDQEGSEADKLKQDFLPIKDTHQAANFDAPPISYHDQCSIAASQQAMRLFRQQYPLTFYGPYFPPFYMPQPYIHHFLRPNGFQQPGDDAPVRPGAKLHVPHIKSGRNIGSSPPTTFPSPYDSYTVAFNHILSAATVNSTHKEEKKENIYTTGPLASAMYNLSLQGQPLAIPTLQAGFTGISQQTQPILAAPTISAMTEQPIGLPRITNQQPQAALTNLDNNY